MRICAGTRPCFACPSVWLSMPEGPVFIYAHHFLPQGTLLLPNISAFLPNFYHLFSRSWRREWDFFPNRLLLNVTPEQGLTPPRRSDTLTGQWPLCPSRQGHPAGWPYPQSASYSTFSKSCFCKSLTMSLRNNNNKKSRKLNPPFYSAMLRLYFSKTLKQMLSERAQV